MAKRIIFLDLTTPKPYDLDTLNNSATGGTEATVTRLAESLSKRGYEVIVAQHNRLTQGNGLANYTSFEALDHIIGNPLAVIALRTPKLIPYAQKLFPDSKLFLYCHDFNQTEIVGHYPLLEGSGVKILAVSRTHKTHIVSALLSQIETIKGLTVDFVYNPISDELIPNETKTNNKKLVFISSPHKGLEKTLALFALLRRRDPEYRLHITNPGYYPDFTVTPEGVVHIGQVPYSQVIEEVRSAFCVFHANTVFPETFGMVYAEANAVGVPCIAHPIGAVGEVLNPAPPQLVNCNDPETVIKRIELWQKDGRPSVSCKSEFRLEKVVDKWELLIKS